MYKYLKTAHLSAQEKTNGGIIYLLPDVFIKVCTLIPLIYLWRVVLAAGGTADMSLDQMLSYTVVSALLADMLVVKTPASGWLSEGILLKLYGRPISVIGQLAAMTIGGWIPMLLCFSLPMAVIATFFGVGMRPASQLFILSLLLCISLGFAIDFLFACLSIKLRNMNWLISRIRMAIVALLSGTFIPIRFLPFGIGEMLRLQPFASLGGAPLAIFVGAADSSETLLLQILWNLLIWPLALIAINRSQEGMVSYGG